MNIHFSGNGSHAILLAAVLLVLVALSFRLRRKLPQNYTCKPKSRRFRSAGVVLGNALQIIHVFVDPGVRYVVAEKLEESSKDDDEDDSADPAIHLERQLRRIRRGEQIERLTVRMKKEE
ncbi:MAG: hypothetical protein QOE55_625 [Acidobacteriaceae bacterium]|jgi:hypothetical protein|nr:hypothetical protein [Acidobacteriaceae bacterium]